MGTSGREEEDNGTAEHDISHRDCSSQGGLFLRLRAEDKATCPVERGQSDRMI